MKKNKSILLLIQTIIIIFFIPILKQLAFYFVKFGYITDYDSINPGIVLFLSVPVLVYIYIKDIIKLKRKLTIFDYILYAFIVFGLISSILAILPKISFFGKPYRHEGFLSLISYYLLMINWSINGTSKNTKILLKCILLISIINSLYGIFQIYSTSPLILRYAADKQMASGICGNPNFFGTLMALSLSMVSTIFLTKKFSVKYLALNILFFISLINCQSTGPFLSYIITLVVIIILSIKKRMALFKNILILLITLILTFFFIRNIDNKIQTKTYNYSRCELCEIKTTIKSGGNGRLQIWENSLYIVRDNPLFGVGYDNLVLAYPNKKSYTYFATDESGMFKQYTEVYEVIDNAHNVYLQTLVSSGILGTIPYIVLCLIIFIMSIKSNKKIVFILFSCFFVYSIQAFANISVIQVAPLYYIVMGLIISNNKT